MRRRSLKNKTKFDLAEEDHVVQHCNFPHNKPSVRLPSLRLAGGGGQLAVAAAGGGGWQWSVAAETGSLDSNHVWKNSVLRM